VSRAGDQAAVYDDVQQTIARWVKRMIRPD
jgi:hypothetical protein